MLQAPAKAFLVSGPYSGQASVTDEVSSYLDAWGDLLAILVERQTTDIANQAGAAADRLARAIAEGRTALAGDLAGIREAMAASQRDVSRVGRELVRTGATLEALQNTVAALRPALDQVPERAPTALARDVARNLARERQLREAAERAALDDILAALDGLELNLEVGQQLLGTFGAAPPDRSRRPPLLVHGWQALGTLLGMPAHLGTDPARRAAVESLLAGIQITYRRLLDALARRGVTAIEATGAPFDPYLYEAVAVEPCAPPQDGRVLREQRRGYRTSDSVVRLAQVVVGRAAR